MMNLQRMRTLSTVSPGSNSVLNTGVGRGAESGMFSNLPYDVIGPPIRDIGYICIVPRHVHIVTHRQLDENATLFTVADVTPRSNRYNNQTHPGALAMSFALGGITLHNDDGDDTTGDTNGRILYRWK